MIHELYALAINDISEDEPGPEARASPVDAQANKPGQLERKTNVNIYIIPILSFSTKLPIIYNRGKKTSRMLFFSFLFSQKLPSQYYIHSLYTQKE